jgi:hypothetical protein
MVKQHRMPSATLTAPIGAVFVIDHVEKWPPTQAQATAAPALAAELHRPMLLPIPARRPVAAPQVA